MSADKVGGKGVAEDLFCRTVIWRGIEGADAVGESALYDFRGPKGERVGIELVVESSGAEDERWQGCRELRSGSDHYQYNRLFRLRQGISERKGVNGVCRREVNMQFARWKKG